MLFQLAKVKHNRKLVFHYEIFVNFKMLIIDKNHIQGGQYLEYTYTYTYIIMISTNWWKHQSPPIVIICVYVCTCVWLRHLKFTHQILSKQYSITIITRLYIRSPELTHLVIASLYPLTGISPFLPPSQLWKLNTGMSNRKTTKSKRKGRHGGSCM